MSTLILFLAATVLLGLFRTPAHPIQAVGLVLAAGLTGHLTKVLSDMLRARRKRIEECGQCDVYRFETDV